MNTVVKSYILGFLLSVALTLAAYFITAQHLLIGGVLIFVIVSLGLIQLWVQLIFFLHLGESGSGWNLAVFLTTISLVLILVGGSLWIIHNLNYNHGHKTDQEIFQYEGIYK
jgi:cytochrome o ubiquinol oxidase operon protein cyoD